MAGRWKTGVGVGSALIFMLAWGLWLSGSITAPKPGGPDGRTVVVHRHQNERNGQVNQFLVETDDAVVAIDGGFLRRDVEAVQSLIDSIGKPLRAILLTHAHHDHTNGLWALSAGGSVPVYAAPRTVREARSHDYRSRLRHLIPEYPEQGDLSFVEVRGGFELAVDGVTFKLLEMGPGESEWDAVWIADDGRIQRAFVGDILLNQVHGFFQSGSSAAWVASLEELQATLPEDAEVFPGHGPPAPDGHAALAWETDYIRRFRGAVENLAAGADSLTASQEQALYAEASSWLTPPSLEFLILLSGDVVAKELALEAERRRVDDKLNSLGG